MEFKTYLDVFESTYILKLYLQKFLMSHYKFCFYSMEQRHKLMRKCHQIFFFYIILYIMFDFFTFPYKTTLSMASVTLFMFSPKHWCLLNVLSFL